MQCLRAVQGRAEVCQSLREREKVDLQWSDHSTERKNSQRLKYRTIETKLCVTHNACSKQKRRLKKDQVSTPLHNTPRQCTRQYGRSRGSPPSAGHSWDRGASERERERADIMNTYKSPYEDEIRCFRYEEFGFLCLNYPTLSHSLHPTLCPDSAFSLRT